MLSPNEKKEAMCALRREILSLQGLVKSSGTHSPDMGLGPIEKAFPDHSFPIQAVHEFISYQPEAAAATNGFIAGLLGRLMFAGGACLWISTRRTVYPPALKQFGIEPDRIIFMDCNRDREALWAIEEALKCTPLAVVVGECRELDFTASRRLQLAVEQHRVTALLHRYNPRAENTVACTTRWKIKPLASLSSNGLPGVGLPRWRVELVKVRNGKPGTWELAWKQGHFYIDRGLAAVDRRLQTLKTGTDG